MQGILRTLAMTFVLFAAAFAGGCGSSNAPVTPNLEESGPVTGKAPTGKEPVLKNEGP